MTIKINDFDGIISLVNSKTYNTYVSENWELEQLKRHFVTQMNANSIIVWQTNNFGGGEWKIKISMSESDELAFSEFNKLIEVTDNKLYLADYTDLTMAAQFKTNKIPADYAKNQFFEIENGVYNAKVRRLFNPDEQIKGDKIAFEIVMERTKTKEIDEVNKVFWWTF
jgi:hypothetical protein